MSEKRVCPGCGRHCSLEEPRCGRGEEYLRTGELPQLGHKKDTCRGSYGGHRHASDINDLLVYDLLDLSHIMRSQYEGKASQKRILIILNESENITQRDLTERLGIQPGSASEILAKLENAGLILRTQNEADRRTIDIYLTDEGKAFAEEALVQRRKRHEDMFSGLSEEESSNCCLCWISSAPTGNAVTVKAAIRTGPITDTGLITDKGRITGTDATVRAGGD